MLDIVSVIGFALESNLLDNLCKLTCLSRETDSSSQKTLDVSTLLIEFFDTSREVTEVLTLLRSNLVYKLNVL